VITSNDEVQAVTPKLRIFLAGATGVLGIRLVPLLLADGHTVAGMTRSAGKVDEPRGAGAVPVVCDVFDADALTEAVTTFGPDAVIHQLTDLPDHRDELSGFAVRNDRMRTEGTRNLVTAAKAAAARHFLAQSIAWRPPERGEVIDHTNGGFWTSGAWWFATGSSTGPAPSTRTSCRRPRAFTLTPPRRPPRL
jgi:nucleoside-diphosphate-sugar epimerase